MPERSYMLRVHPSLRHLAMLCVAMAVQSVSAADEPAAPQTPAEPAAREHPVPASRSETIAAELKRQLPASEFVNLTADEDFVALWRPANDGDPKGVVILLPGEGESADWPRAIGPLRRGLPDHGWHTLSLSLPDAALPPPRRLDEPAVPPAAAAENAENVGDTSQPVPEPAPSEAGNLSEATAATAPEPDENTADAGEESEPSAPPPMTRPERIAKRIEAALAFARSKQPATIVLLGHGTGAYWAAQVMQQQAPPGVARLVMIEPHQPGGQDEPLAQLVGPLKLPTGDFYYKEGTGNHSKARERLNASRRNRHTSYVQVGLPAKTGNRQVDDEQLLRRIRGWLTRQP